MTLTDKDYNVIAEMIGDREKGKNYVDFEKDDEVLHIEYTYETEGYMDTGGWIETSRYLYIDLAETCKEDGIMHPFDIDTDRLEGLIA